MQHFTAAQYKLHNSVFANRGDGTFEDVSNTVGPDFLEPRAHRGAAFADFNRDGKIDVVATALGESAELWENVTATDNTWLILKLTGTKSNRDGIGAQISIGDQWNHMTTAVGYASSSQFGVHFGTGHLKEVPRIEICWPSGVRQVLTHVPANQLLQVREP